MPCGGNVAGGALLVALRASWPPERRNGRGGSCSRLDGSDMALISLVSGSVQTAGTSGRAADHDREIGLQHATSPAAMVSFRNMLGRYSFHHQHRARRHFHQPVGGAADQPVIE